ncbi:MAG: DUF4249 domain-containing protein [Fulvivirga sp.]
MVGRCLFVLLLFTSCIEQFQPKVDEPDELPLVIDGLITNEFKNHRININRVNTLAGPVQFNFEDEAKVYVESSGGEIFEFSNIGNGSYISDQAFAGTIGESYKLVINLEGKTYESSIEEMPKTAEIDSIKAKYEIKSIQDETGDLVNKPLISILIDVKLSDEQDYYMRLDWEATYKAKTPNQGLGVCWTEAGREPPDNLDPDKICYVNENSTSFLNVLTSDGIDRLTIKDYEAYSVSPNKRIQFMYSPKIYLYSMAKSSYDFWNAVKNQVENTGSLFDAPPTPIGGNIFNMENVNERVLGIFEVASVNSKREFFLRSIITDELDNYNADCSPSGGQLSPPPPPPLYCCECTFLPNSSDKKPDFWED